MKCAFKFRICGVTVVVVTVEAEEENEKKRIFDVSVTLEADWMKEKREELKNMMFWMSLLCLVPLSTPQWLLWLRDRKKRDGK